RTDIAVLEGVPGTSNPPSLNFIPVSAAIAKVARTPSHPSTTAQRCRALKRPKRDNRRAMLPFPHDESDAEIQPFQRACACRLAGAGDLSTAKAVDVRREVLVGWLVSTMNLRALASVCSVGKEAKSCTNN